MQRRSCTSYRGMGPAGRRGPFFFCFIRVDKSPFRSFLLFRGDGERGDRSKDLWGTGSIGESSFI